MWGLGLTVLSGFRVGHMGFRIIRVTRFGASLGLRDTLQQSKNITRVILRRIGGKCLASTFLTRHLELPVSLVATTRKEQGCASLVVYCWRGGGG